MIFSGIEKIITKGKLEKHIIFQEKNFIVLMISLEMCAT